MKPLFQIQKQEFLSVLATIQFDESSTEKNNNINIMAWTSERREARQGR